MVQLKFFVDPFFLNKMGWIKPKNISGYGPFKPSDEEKPSTFSKYKKYI